jgi:acetyl esterase/lipase
MRHAVSAGRIRARELEVQMSMKVASLEWRARQKARTTNATHLPTTLPVRSATATTGKVRSMILWLVGVLGVCMAALVAVYVFTPWPRALDLRYEFDEGGDKTAQKLAQYVPPGITAILDQRYDRDDPAVALDIYHPDGALQRRTTVVWVHGGGWLAGSKEQLGNYARILAGQGFTVAVVGYSLAPKATYPTPVRQVNTALGYLARNADRLGVDPSRLVLAGDSAGSQIALQVATLIVQPAYAQTMNIRPTVSRDQFAGLLLYCGIYRMEKRDEESGVLATEYWAYSGTRDFLRDPHFATAWVLDRINGDYPPAFISVGNGDDLRPQSITLADSLEKNGVRTDRLIFPEDHTPRLPHEYQFEFDRPEARQALDKSVDFLRSLQVR